MTDESCSWQAQAIAALAFIAPAEEWEADPDGDVVLPEGWEHPGWTIMWNGQRIKAEQGAVSFESDVMLDDIGLTARALLAAVNAWDAALTEAPND